MDMDAQHFDTVSTSSVLEILQTLLIMGSSLAIGQALRDALLETVRLLLQMDVDSSSLAERTSSAWIVFSILVLICVPSVFIIHCFVVKTRRFFNRKHKDTSDLV